MFRKFAEKTEREILKICEGLSEVHVNLVIENFRAYRGHLEYIIKLKTKCWDLLPWTIAGLAHDCIATAKAHALLVIPPLRAARQCPEAHHRWTWAFLGDGIIRMIELWAYGAEELRAFPILFAMAALAVSIFFAGQFEQQTNNLMN